MTQNQWSKIPDVDLSHILNSVFSQKVGWEMENSISELEYVVITFFSMGTKKLLLSGLAVLHSKSGTSFELHAYK